MSRRESGRCGVRDQIHDEYEKSLAKRNEIRDELRRLERADSKDTYAITIARDRLAYWEGKVEGLKFAIDLFDRT